MSEAAPLTPRQQQVLEFIDARGPPARATRPSVREIGEAVGLSSSSTVHAHLAALQDKGYLRRDPTKPRAIEVCFEPDSGAIVDRRPVRHVPLVGDVAAGTGVLAAENIEETMPAPGGLHRRRHLFMLRVRGDSMIEAGIFDGVITRAGWARSWQRLSPFCWRRVRWWRAVGRSRLRPRRRPRCRSSTSPSTRRR